MPKTTQWGALRPKLIAVSVAACFALSSPQISANPTGASVVSGAASFATAGSALTITNSANAILNWQGFSIGANEIARFIQPSALSAVLNRVVGSGGVVPRSVIDGILASNGRVFLLNPSGIIVGKGATIDTAGILLSSLNLSDQDFLNGRLRFTEVPGAGAVVNNGVIQTAAGGNVYLIAPTVENNGLIRSPQGEIVLAAGKSVELVADSSPYVTVRVTADTQQAVNVGSLIADSGRVGVYGALVRNSGVAEANGAMMGDGGQIRFVATKDLNIEAGSRISANGGAGGNVLLQAEGGSNLIAGTVEATGSSGKGGTVQALGVRVGVIGHGVIDASGETGGGTVLVGGDYQGKNPGVQNAQSTEIGADGVIRADARTTGDGGRVIVWADGDTKFAGTISARGGSQSGDGGFVETSGEQLLTVSGLVNTGAPNGKGGMWLLDPAGDQLIDAGMAASLVASMSYGGASVIAGNDINFGASIAGAGTTGSFNAQAGNNINLNSQTITAGTGSVHLAANAYGGGTGSITSTIGGATQITTNGGSVSLTGVGVTVGGIVTHGANGATPGAGGLSGGSVTITAYGGAVNAGAIDTSGGNGAAGANASSGFGGSGGSGGSVNITSSTSSIATGSITTRGGDGGQGGSFSRTGTVSDSISVQGGGGGSGNSVNLNASGPLTVNGAINTQGGRGANGGTGSITINSDSESSPSASVFASGAEGGHGGVVNLFGSTITTQDVTSRGGDGGNGGSATIVVNNAFNVNASADARGVGSESCCGVGMGGAVFMSSIGHISAGTIDTRGGQGGNGGNASIAANNVAGGNVSATANARGGDGGEGGAAVLNSGALFSISVGNIFTMAGSGGRGGVASISVSGSTSSVNASAFASGGRGFYGGFVGLFSNGPVQAGVIDTRGGSGGNGGSASIVVSGSPSSVSATADARGGDVRGGHGFYGGSVGSVGIISNGSIATGAITTRGGGGGNGGTASISVSGSPSSVSATANASGGHGFYGGAVVAVAGSPFFFGDSTAHAGSILTGSIDTRGGNGGNGGSASIAASPSEGGFASADASGGNGGFNVNSMSVYGGFFGFGFGGQGSAALVANGSVNSGTIFTSGGRGGNAGTAAISGSISQSTSKDGGDGGDGGFIYVYGSGVVNINVGGSPIGAALDASGGAGGAGGAGGTAGRGGDGGDGGTVQVAGIPTIMLWGSINSSGGAGGAGGSGSTGGDGGFGGLGGDITLDAANGDGSIFVFLNTSFNPTQGAGGAGGSPGGLPGSTAFDDRLDHSGPGILSILGQLVLINPLSIPELLAAYQQQIGEMPDPNDDKKKDEDKDKDKEDFKTCKP